MQPTEMQLVDRLRAEARKVGATIAFPDGDDPRVVIAALRLAIEGIARPLLVGDESRIHATARELCIALPREVRVIDPVTFPGRGRLATELYQIRGAKGLSQEEAGRLSGEPLYLATMLVRFGIADGCVAGAAQPTGQVLRSAFEVIGLAPGVRTASSVFLMILPEGRTLTFADCAVLPYPNATQLAEIAVASARTHQRLTGESPSVAMLSFSTKGSATHESVLKVREATALAQAMAPEIAIDGELQFDAAYVEHVGSRKAPDSPVAGRANVFVFPNLDAGNIGYKIVERVGGAEALGPILQGLAKPIHDLSRGCKTEDVVTLSAICALQSTAARAPLAQRDYIA